MTRNHGSVLPTSIIGWNFAVPAVTVVQIVNLIRTVTLIDKVIIGLVIFRVFLQHIDARDIVGVKLVFDVNQVGGLLEV